MPTLATLQAFAATVEANDHVGAIINFYAADAVTRENNSPPIVGRDVLAEKERRVLASVAGVKTTRLGPLLLDGEPRSATVVATEPTTVAVQSKSAGRKRPTGKIIGAKWVNADGGMPRAVPMASASPWTSAPRARRPSAAVSLRSP